MPRGKKKSMGSHSDSPFKDLDDEFKVAVEQANDGDIKTRIADIALAEQQNSDLKKSDQQLMEAKQAFADAGEQYREATKFNKLKIKYCSHVLESRGKA